MITFGKPIIYKKGKRYYLKAPLTISNDTALAYKKISDQNKNCTWLVHQDYPPQAWDKEDFGLWFAVDEEFGRYLCAERSNAFVVMMLWYALTTHSDIKFEAPMSASLYKNLTEKLIPALTEEDEIPIKLIGPVSEEPLWSENALVTGMSAGVDSFYTLRCYYNEETPSYKKLTHLTVFDSYLFSPDLKEMKLDEAFAIKDKANTEVIRRASKIALDANLPLLHISSNQEIDIYRGGIMYCAMYRYCALALAVEHLIKNYISSSSGHGISIEKGVFVPSQHYEDLLIECFKTENFSYLQSDTATRVQKLKFLADDSLFQKYASVCFNDCGCSKCYACWKTMIPLDIMGKLANYDSVFDLDYYYSNKEQVFEDFVVFSHRPEASSARESVKQIASLAKEYNTDTAKLFLNVLAKNSIQKK